MDGLMEKRSDQQQRHTIQHVAIYMRGVCGAGRQVWELEWKKHMQEASGGTTMSLFVVCYSVNVLLPKLAEKKMSDMQCSQTSQRQYTARHSITSHHTHGSQTDTHPQTRD
mmetsp:Transcript_25954/g.74654  ORF Transcript_25954/g.74654 Transcript_25954/m.74654 type:complete len:111 (+) Transcript_25954:48-380(+)